MSDGRGTGAGSASDSGQNDPRQGRQAPYAPDPEPRVLEGRVIPSQSNSPTPPQRRPGQSGHAPGAHAARRAARLAARQDPQQDPQPDPQQTHPDPRQTPGQAPQAQRPGWGGPQSRPQPQRPQRPGPGGPGSGSGPEPGPGPGRQDPPQQPLTPSFQPRSARRPDEPDWDALASASQSRSRKRRLLMIGGGVLATAAVAGAVAFAVVSSSGEKGTEADSTPSAASPTGSEAGEPEFPDITPPPPPDPLAIISSADKDTAPLTPETIFPGKRFTLGDRAYAEGPTSSTENCADVALKGLAPVLTTNGCRQVLRASYTRDGVSITVGIAVFDDKKSANAVRKQATGHVKPLTGDGVGTFCTPVSCWSSTNAIGRYAYFTMAGLSDNTAVTSTETKAKQGGRDVSTFAFRQITQRGRDAAGQ